MCFVVVSPQSNKLDKEDSETFARPHFFPLCAKVGGYTKGKVPQAWGAIAAQIRHEPRADGSFMG